MVAYRERVLQVGPDKSLVGIATLPSGEATAAPILLPNAGYVHRIGPHRMHVRLARALAALGVPVLRFDLHGLGDSGPGAAGRDYLDQGVEDVRTALDAMAQVLGREVTGAGLIGLCAGADIGYRAALADPRISRLALLDPYAYGTSGARLERVARKAADGGRWLRAAGRLLKDRPAAPVPTTEADGPEEDAYENERPVPPAEEFGADLSTLTARGADILIRYTRFVQEELTRPAHFFASFPNVSFHDRLTVEVDREADHTYTLLSAQARLIDRLTLWGTATKGINASGETRKQG